MKDMDVKERQKMMKMVCEGKMKPPSGMKKKDACEHIRVHKMESGFVDEKLMDMVKPVKGGK